MGAFPGLACPASGGRCELVSSAQSWTLHVLVVLCTDGGMSLPPDSVWGVLEVKSLVSRHPT